MFKQKLSSTISLAVTLSVMAIGLFSSKASAQEVNTLRDPLISGASSAPADIPAPRGPRPPLGSGSTPLPVTPGMPGPQTYEPWVPTLPFNSVDQVSTGVGLPVAPPLALPPGVLGPLLTPLVPPSSSTPGAMPNYLQAPQGFTNPAMLDQVPAGGKLPGTGGYYGSINNVRRGGQQTFQFEKPGLTSILGGGGLSQDEITQFGPLAGWGMPFGVPTGNGYNNGPAGTNADNRLEDIDLGGGMAVKVGGQVIPLGQTIQDFGRNNLYGNGVLGLGANRSTEFGQGRRGEPSIQSSNTTDFGLHFQQINQANLGVQDTAAGGIPNAIETNF